MNHKVTTSEVRHAADWGRDYVVRPSEFDAWITEHDAKVRAETLREAAEAARNEAINEPYAGSTFISHADWLNERADRIEKEAEQ